MVEKNAYVSPHVQSLGLLQKRNYSLSESNLPLEVISLLDVFTRIEVRRQAKIQGEKGK